MSTVVGRSLFVCRNETDDVGRLNESEGTGTSTETPLLNNPMLAATQIFAITCASRTVRRPICSVESDYSYSSDDMTALRGARVVQDLKAATSKHRGVSVSCQCHKSKF